jgi:CPA2 family monovalent cation:H+ antiporter-2
VEIPLLTDIVIVLGLSILVILGFRKLGLPSILGFLVTGVIAGPHGLSLVEASHEIDVLAEIGVILLLFVVGLEFSLSSLSAIKQAILVGGGMQVAVTVLLVGIIATQLGYPANEATFLGFMFSLSSTAIVLRAIQDKRATHSPQGRVSLAVLIFQDIIVVLMMLLAPLLAGVSQSPTQDILLLLAKGAGIIGFALVSARTLVPWVLYRITRTQSRELFILTIVVICFAVAWLTSTLGLSLSLGATGTGEA